MGEAQQIDPMNKDLGKFISAETIARINTKIFSNYKTSVELLMNNEEDDDMKNE